jgi:hypothetical protein
MDELGKLISACTIAECACGFYHAPIRPCPETHRDDAMNRRCNKCEHIVHLCTCEWGRIAKGEQT